MKPNDELDNKYTFQNFKTYSEIQSEYNTESEDDREVSIEDLKQEIVRLKQENDELQQENSDLRQKDIDTDRHASNIEARAVYICNIAIKRSKTITVLKEENKQLKELISQQQNETTGKRKSAPEIHDLTTDIVHSTIKKVAARRKR